MEKRNISLQNGSTLELELSEKFYEAIRHEYELPKDFEITDEIIKSFIFGTVKNAVDKAEKEILWIFMYN